MFWSLSRSLSPSFLLCLCVCMRVLCLEYCEFVFVTSCVYLLCVVSSSVYLDINICIIISTCECKYTDIFTYTCTSASPSSWQWSNPPPPFYECVFLTTGDANPLSDHAMRRRGLLSISSMITLTPLYLGITTVTFRGLHGGTPSPYPPTFPSALLFFFFFCLRHPWVVIYHQAMSLSGFQLLNQSILIFKHSWTSGFQNDDFEYYSNDHALYIFWTTVNTANSSNNNNKNKTKHLYASYFKKINKFKIADGKPYCVSAVQQLDSQTLLLYISLSVSSGKTKLNNDQITSKNIAI